MIEPGYSGINSFHDLSDALVQPLAKVAAEVIAERYVIAAELGRDAAFLAGLARYPADGEPHKSNKVLYALSYREDPVKPTFVVDISDQFEQKMAAIKCYASQFEGATAAGEIFPTGQDLYARIETQNAHYGSLIRTRYGEPFHTEETVLIEDVVAMGVVSM